MISTIDDIVDGLANSSSFVQIGTAAPVCFANFYYSAWLAAGTPGGGVIPPLYNSNGPYTCASGIPGSLPIPPATNQNYLAAASLSDSVGGDYILADRLWACTIVNPDAGTYVVSTPGTLPERIVDSGRGCLMMLEWYVGGTQTASTWIINYKDESGVDRTTPVSISLGSGSPGFAYLMPHAPGAYGVSQITSIVKTGNATTVTVSVGVTIIKPVLNIPCIGSNINSNTLDWGQTRLTKLHNDGCYMFYRFSAGTVASQISGNLTVIDK